MELRSVFSVEAMGDDILEGKENKVQWVEISQT